MNIRFHIHYGTEYGQSLFLSGSSPSLGDGDPELAIRMQYVSDGTWVLDWTGPVPDETEDITYQYMVKDDRNGALIRERNGERRLPRPAGDFGTVHIHDQWRACRDPETMLFSSAFTHVIFSRPRRNPHDHTTPTAADGTSLVLRFEVGTVRVAPQHRLAVLGNVEALGAWDERRPLVLADHAFPLWQGEVGLAGNEGIVEYKYVVWDPESKKVVIWEAGENRTIQDVPGAAPDPLRPDRPDPPPVDGAGTLVVRSDVSFRFVDNWRGAGVAVPVFSLRSGNGMGVGEFPDLKVLVDWCRQTGLQMIQILPVNETVASHTWIDTYPYSCISVFALHPLYMNLEAMDGVPAELYDTRLRDEAARLNAMSTMDYEAVMEIKSRFYKQAFDACRDQFLSSPEFLAFFESEKSWLQNYAAYCYLRDHYGTSDHNQWGEHERISPEQIAQLCSPRSEHYDDIAVHYFIQFHLHRQLLDAARYAREQGVVLKGDIPIGVNRTGVDTWVHPDLFHMDRQAGAPPDAFDADGQNWGFPTYNWDAMARDGFAWWQKRLRKMATCFDAYRVDHILGFFRIWAIPWTAVSGMLGHFSPALPVLESELAAAGLPVDRQRLCAPYLPARVRDDLGEETFETIRPYLEDTPDGRFRLKEGYETQREIKEAFDREPPQTREERERQGRLREVLSGLAAEVLFLEGPEGQEGQGLHPRFDLQKTRSFEDLPAETQSELDRIYIDYYYRRQEDLWRSRAMVKLPSLKRTTDMLICAEDLGLIPACVPGVLEELGILGLRIQRMPREINQEFDNPQHYPYGCVSTPSCHDTSTVRGWWEEDPERSQRFYSQMLGRNGDAPRTCEPDICEAIVAQHLHAPNMWTVFPIQDLLGMDAALRRKNPTEEQINDPTVTPFHYWRFRLHVSLEELLAADDFSDRLRGMIENAGRDRKT